MQRFLQALGLAPKPTTQVQSRLHVSQLNDGKLQCQWQLGSEAQPRHKSKDIEALMLRLTDETSDQDFSKPTAVQEFPLEAAEGSCIIPLPTNSGMISIQLGFRGANGVWTSLVALDLDLGPRLLMQTSASIWWKGSRESRDIHEVMYRIATQNSSIGGSELLGGK